MNFDHFLLLQFRAGVFEMIFDVDRRFIVPGIILGGIKILIEGIDERSGKGDVGHDWGLLVEDGFVRFSFLFSLMGKGAAWAKLALA